MKQVFLKIIFPIGLAVLLLACGPARRGSFALVADENFGDDASYAFGMDIGTWLKANEIYPNLTEFLRGITDVLNGLEPRFTPDEASFIIEDALNVIFAQRGEALRLAEIEFLLQNSENPGVFVTESGLQYEIISEGDGPRPGIFDTVRVHFEGSFIDGSVFENSNLHGEPAELPLIGIFPGMTEGLQLMNVGSRYRFFIPSDLALGSQGGPQIPPYSTLIFDIELLEIVDQ